MPQDGCEAELPHDGNEIYREALVRRSGGRAISNFTYPGCYL